MNRFLLSLGLTLGLSIVGIGDAIALQPAPVRGNSKVQWSKVVETPFDGRIIYDKDFEPGKHELVTSWSASEIRATFTRYWQEIVGYRTEWKTRTYYDRRGRKRHEEYPDRVPIYESRSQDYEVISLLIALDGKVHEYTGGEISTELAEILSKAPRDKNVPVRAVLSDGNTVDMEIGTGTTAAWRSLYGNRVKPHAGGASGL
jgi:hypothetical protein